MDTLLNDWLANGGKAVAHKWLADGGGPLPEPLLSPGTAIGDYRVSGLIGRGGFAEVYRAVHSKLGSAAVVKVLHRLEPAAVERFDREARFLSGHPHPSLPRFMEYGSHCGHPFIVMEELESRELPSSDRDVARFMDRLCESVGYLHANGVVHRDIKPDNILFRKDGSPVLIDFGLLKSMAVAPGAAGDTISIADGRAVAIGTPGFSAPEQFSGGDISPAADVHALGSVAEACFRGRPPAAWRAIIRRATSSLLRERYPSVGAFMGAVRWRHAIHAAPFAAVALSVVVAAAAFAFYKFMSAYDAAVGPVAESWREYAETRRDSEGSYDCLRLDGEHLTISYPIRVVRGKRLVIEGSGILEVEIRGDRRGRVVMRKCAVFNTTDDPDPAHSPRFVLEGGSYLNFLHLEGLDERDFADPYDPSTSVVAFGGPTTSVRKFLDRLKK